MKDSENSDIMDFEEYCLEVLEIFNIDFLSRKEWDIYYEKYENYLKRELGDDFEL